MFELVKQKEGFETKLQALESPDSDKRAKIKLKRTSDQRSRSEKSRNKSEKKKNKEQVNERTFLSGSKRKTRSLK